MSERKIKIGITHGDTNGIGYEVIMKALSGEEMLQLCTPIIYGASKVLSYHRKAIDMQQFSTMMCRNADNARDGAVNLIDVMGGEEVKIDLGEPSKTAGRAAFLALEAAVSDLKAGRIDALVTAPINKDNIQSDQFHFAGHTEYLESSCEGNDKALMVLFDEHVRVALVTTHLPLAKVAEAITEEAIITCLRIFNESLRRDFGIERPRIAVLSLNPHAGDNGLLGNEEKDIIAPAISTAYDEHIMCFGPYPSDSFFAMEQYRHFDGVLAMYHDQGLTPFKTIARSGGVNFTAGLPIVRTSPDHGTGYDIAGKNIADETSMRHAIFAAIDICRNRVSHDEAYSNPLEKLYEARGKDNVVLDLTQEEMPS